MAFPSLFNLPSSEESFLRFTFENSEHHRAITQATLAQHSVTLPTYILDPVYRHAMPTWLLHHQLMHNAMNNVLNLIGNDLTTVDFNDKEQLSNWIELHAEEHRAAAMALRLTV